MFDKATTFVNARRHAGTAKDLAPHAFAPGEVDDDEPRLTQQELDDLHAAMTEALAVPDDGSGVKYRRVDDAHA